MTDKERIQKLEAIIVLALQFFASLPRGWLGKTSADVGLLNDFYLACRDMNIDIPRKKS